MKVENGHAFKILLITGWQDDTSASTNWNTWQCTIRQLISLQWHQNAPYPSSSTASDKPPLWSCWPHQLWPCSREYLSLSVSPREDAILSHWVCKWVGSDWSWAWDRGRSIACRYLYSCWSSFVTSCFRTIWSAYYIKKHQSLSKLPFYVYNSSLPTVQQIKIYHCLMFIV